jgi:hypothetical protein
MRRAVGALACIAALGVQPLAAQDLTPQPTGGRSWVAGFSHYAKWGVLASAVAFTALSLRAHSDADIYFSGLKQFCAHANDQCQTGPDGAYVNADAEHLWQATAQSDREARGWLIGAEASLVVSGGMFLVDLVSGNTRPKNIPFTPFQVYSKPDRLGLQISF